MRPRIFLKSAILAILFLANPWNQAAADTAPLAAKLVGAWTCQGQENDATLELTLDYRLRNGWLVGEIVEDNGATMLDVWLDDGSSNPLALRRLLSYDATVEMQLVEESAEHLKLEGAMRFVLGNAGAVREEIRFTGNDRFEALWEAVVDDEWVTILSRSCTRSG